MNNSTNLKWYSFDALKGSRQKRPQIKKAVLVLLSADKPEKFMGLVFTPTKCIAVGYRKDAAGDKQCPKFIVPGNSHGRKVIAWCDCLPDNFDWPRME